MTIVVDANILFSALITPNGKLAKILAYPKLPAKLVSCQFLVTELLKHQQKIIKLSKRSAENINEDLYYYLKNIQLYDESFIHEAHWLEAERLTLGVDRFDVNYVALALQTSGWLWTGDKQLTEHLRTIGFDRILNTTELYKRLEID